MVYEAPQATNELMPFQITLDGVVQTSTVSYSIVPEENTVPGSWAAAELLNSATHARISGLSVGYYRLFVKMTVGTETPVVDCGVFRIY